MNETEKTEQQFETVIRKCRVIFLAKMKDYGSSWRILRIPSLTDQVLIKANRIRSIESKGTRKVEEGIIPEYIGIVNYSVMALIQLELGEKGEMILTPDEAEQLYNKHIYATRDLMLRKNHDYAEIWREMRLGSLTDIILMKLMRIKQIEDNRGKTFISEGIDANYQDIINYSIFALIKLGEPRVSQKSKYHR
jgi:Nucleotide modification associated domain 1